jgi:hypothetical protein
VLPVGKEPKLRLPTKRLGPVTSLGVATNYKLVGCGEPRKSGTSHRVAYTPQRHHRTHRTLSIRGSRFPPNSLQIGRLQALTLSVRGLIGCVRHAVLVRNPLFLLLFDRHRSQHRWGRTRLNTRTDWLSSLLSTGPADRARAESSLRDLYTAAFRASTRTCGKNSLPWEPQFAKTRTQPTR